MSWFSDLARKFTGAESPEELAERERQDRATAADLAELELQKSAAQAILAEHDARPDFSGQEALDRLIAQMPEVRATELYANFLVSKVQPVLDEVLEDGLLSPEEDARIEALRARYSRFQIGPDTARVLATARDQYKAWTEPLEAVTVPLLLKRGEYCVYSVQAEAFEERTKTVRVDYAGPVARVRIMKGLYYRAGSISGHATKQAYQHSFGKGILGATSKRLLWVSAAHSISIPLAKIVNFEPFIDGIKIMKDSGKPLLFVFDAPDQTGMVKLARVIEELR